MFLAFYVGRGETLLDRAQEWAISKVTRSPFTHVELIPTGQAAVLGRAYPCISASSRDGGVRQKDIFLSAASWRLLPVPWAPATTEAVIRSYLGARYDYTGIILSHVIGFNRQDPKRWFCSEIIAHALGFERAYRYSPADLYSVCSAMNAAFHVGMRWKSSFNL